MGPEVHKIGQDTPAMMGTAGQPTVQQKEYEEKDLTGEKDSAEEKDSAGEKYPTGEKERAEEQENPDEKKPVKCREHIPGKDTVGQPSGVVPGGMPVPGLPAMTQTRKKRS